MNVLAIGNSFSQDATRYLHAIARRAGEKLTVVNLYIGGCSLERHFRNMHSEERAYELQINGERSGFFVSLKEALLNRAWDVVTLQQASHESFNYENYTPYLEYIYEHVKRYCPKAKVYIHQTWAYEEGSDRLQKMGYLRAEDMFADVKRAYATAAEVIGADGIIPSGTAMFNATQMGIDKIHRDTFHASYGAGRYLLALTWYKALTGKDISGDRFCDFDEPVSDAEIEIIKKAVNSAF